MQSISAERLIPEGAPNMKQREVSKGEGKDKSDCLCRL